MVNHLKINKIAESQNEYKIWETLLDDYIIGIGWTNDNTLIAALTSAGNFAVLNHQLQTKQHDIKAHTNGAISLAVSPKENNAVTTGQDGFMRLWDIESGKLLKEVKMQTLWVEHATWSFDGKYFAVSAGNTLKVFNKEGILIFEYDKHESTVSGIEWRSDSMAFATACYGGVRLFEIDKQQPYKFLEWKNSMLSLSWSPDDQYIACGTQDSRVHFFPLPYTDGADFEMNGYKGKVKILNWTNDAKYFLTNCWDEIVVWKFAGKSPQGQSPITLNGHLSKITQAEFQNRNTFLASGDDSGMVLFFDVEIGDKFITGIKLQNPISKIEWSADDNLLAVGTAHGEIIIMESPA
ncbi:MAG: hypothetical protein H0U95_13980 [Bacteroidetes bacterium]|nr:hypothetical protein [Bacteroidota bacterium]